MEALTETKNTTLSLQNMNRLLDSFKDFLELDEETSQKTFSTYYYAVKQLALWLDRNGITRPTREDLIAFREELKRDHKPSTVQNYITAIRRFFQWTEEAKLYPNISKNLKGCKLDKGHKKDYLTSHQIKKVLDEAKDTSEEGLRNYAILALMFTGGLRTIEVSRADIGDVRTVGDTTVLYVQGKGRTEKTEYVKLVPEVEDAIRAYLNARGEIRPTEPLFASLSHNSKGARLSTRSVSGIVKAAMVKAGFSSDRLTAHSARHSAITLALLGGETLEEVQQFARHSNINTTLIYSHALERAKNNCESTIAKAIF